MHYKTSPWYKKFSYARQQKKIVSYSRHFCSYLGALKWCPRFKMFVFMIAEIENKIKTARLLKSKLFTIIGQCQGDDLYFGSQFSMWPCVCVNWWYLMPYAVWMTVVFECKFYVGEFILNSFFIQKNTALSENSESIVCDFVVWLLIPK